MHQRNLILTQDEPDSYMQQLFAQVRHLRDTHLLDLLLVSHIAKAREYERLTLMMEHLEESIKQYRPIIEQEKTTTQTFYTTARAYFALEITIRQAQLLSIEPNG